MTKARLFDLQPEEELQVRAFFGVLAARCGREVEAEPEPKKKRRLFGR